MSSPIYRHDLDPTGLSPDNRVLREPVTLANYPVRVFVPSFGAFFGDSMVITDTATGAILLKSQYYLSQPAHVPTLKYGKGIYYCVVITDTSVSANLSIDYQDLGGEWAYSNSALANQLQVVLGDARAVDYSALINKPNRFNPGPHLHDAGDVFGMEYLVEALYAIRDSISLDGTASMIAIYDQTIASLNALATTVQSVRTELYQSINGLLNQIAALQSLAARVTALENANVVVPPVYPVAGTVLSHYCSGTTQYAVIANGSGGTENLVSEYNSVACGYQIPAVTPTYRIAPNVNYVDEGSSVTFTVTTTDVPNNTVLAYLITGTAVGADFVDGMLEGTYVINNNTGSFIKGISADSRTDGTKVFSASVTPSIGSGTTLWASESVTINDTSQASGTVLTPTYSITPNVTSVDEGSSVTFNIATTNVADGTILYCNVHDAFDGVDVSAADFIDITMTADVTIINNSGSFTRTTRADATTEGFQSFTVKVRTGSQSGPIVATSSLVAINDTSTTPVIPTYAITVDRTTLNALDQAVFTLTRTNGVDPAGTTYYFDASGNDVSAILIDGALPGVYSATRTKVDGSNPTLTITNTGYSLLNNSGNDQTMVVNLRSGGHTGAILASSALVALTIDTQN